ncbi:hypothetical protein NKDENANG_03443 [Candidatus Entotheonellaceae bacterium PAL068K]
MLVKLLSVFIAVPLIEIILFIEIGSRLGTWTTLLVIAVTAILGASLAHREGVKTWWRLQERLYRGLMPDEELLDGLLILIAGAVLLTPGFLTDAAGFLLLYSGTRQGVKRWLRHRFSQRLQRHYRDW